MVARASGLVVFGRKNTPPLKVIDGGAVCFHYPFLGGSEIECVASIHRTDGWMGEF